MWTSTGFERLIRRWEEDAAVGLDDINGISKDGTTLLHAACGTGRHRLVTRLLKAGVNPNPVNYWRFTPLSIACKNKDLRVVAALLKHGSGFGWDPSLFVAAAGHLKITKLLLDGGLKPDFRAVRAALELELDERNLELIKRLIESLPDSIDVPLELDHLLASKCGHCDIEVTRLLLELGADPNWQYGTSSDPVGALDLTLEYGRRDAVELLLDHGAKIDLHRPSLFSAQHASLEIFTLLLDRGADIEADIEAHDDEWILDGNVNESTALSRAITHGYTEIVKLLLARGANRHRHVAGKPFSSLTDNPEILGLLQPRVKGAGM